MTNASGSNMSNMSNTTGEVVRRTAMRQFARNGYDGTSMAMVAREVGVTKASLYYFYPNKASLYLAVVRDIINEMINLFATDPRRDPRGVFRSVIRESIERGVTYGLVLQPLDEERFREVNDELAAIQELNQTLSKTCVRFMQRCGIPQAQFVAQMIQDANRSFIMRHCHHPTESDIRTYTNQMVRFIFSSYSL